jgi:uncharacterized protein YukE
MSGDGDLAYEHAAIEQMCSDLKALVGKIDSQLSQDVEAEFKVLLTDKNFAGLAAGAFNTASAAWNNECQEYSQMLDRLKTAVHQASTDVNSEDSSLQGLFHG